MKNLFVVLTCAISFVSLHAQKFEWLTTSQTTANWFTNSPLVETDVQGNLLSLSYHAMGGATIITGDDTLQAPGSNYTFVLAKMDSAGAVLWTKWFQIGNGGYWDMCTDANGFIYVGVSMNTTITYEDADTSFNAGLGSGDWLISFDSSGTFRWIIPGFANGWLMQLASSHSTSGVFATSNNNIYRYDSDGNLIWSHSISAGAAWFNGLSCRNNELVASAFTWVNGIVTLDTVSVSSYNSTHDEIIFKMDTSGSVLWAANLPYALTSLTGPSARIPLSLNSSGDVYVSLNLGGQFGVPVYVFAGDTLTNPYGPGIQYCGVLKFSSSGTPLWAKGNAYTNGNSDYFDLLVNRNDEILVCGEYQCAAGFIDNLPLLPSVMSLTSFVAKFDSDGSAVWLKQDYRLANNHYDEAYRLSQGPDNTYYLGGHHIPTGPLEVGCFSNNLSHAGHYYTRISENEELSPAIDFDFYRSNNTFYFQNNSENYTSFQWSFGDGAVEANIVSPSHEYLNKGAYQVCLEAYNACGRAQVCKQVGIKGITDVFPNRVSNYGTNFFSVRGYFPGYNPGQIKLIRAGSPDLVPDTAMAADNVLIRTRMDLVNADTGWYSLVVIPASGTPDTLENAVLIESPSASDIDIQVTGLSTIRTSRWGSYQVHVTNRGNKTEFAIPLLIEITNASGISLFSLESSTNDMIRQSVIDSISDYILLTDTATGEVSLNGFLGIPYLLPGETYTFRLYLKSTVDKEFFIKAHALPSLYESDQLFDLGIYHQRTSCDFLPKCLACLVDLGAVVPGLNCASTAPFNLGCVIGNNVNCIFYQTEDCYFLPFNYLKYLAEFVAACTGSSAVANATGAIAKLKAALVSGIIPGISGLGDGDCKDCMKDPKSGFTKFRFSSSVDPNVKYGNSGFTSENYISKHQQLDYVIRFENMDTATAPASIVHITDALDTALLDLSTFSFTGFGWGDSAYFFKEKTDTAAREFDLRPSKNAILRVLQSLDKSTGIIECQFLALDPVTYEIVPNPFDGFLPPNVNSPEGEGFISYRVKPKTSAAHLDVIANNAEIVFDYNAPIVTNTWVNTIDTVKPASNVLALNVAQPDTAFVVRWTGNDAHAGMKSYALFVSINDSAYTLWLAGTEADSAIFYGKEGYKYEFYSVAKDLVNNMEGHPLNPETNPDAVTTVSITSINNVDGNADILIYPNPAESILNIRSAEDLKKITITNLLGKQVFESLLHGVKQVQLRIDDLSSGIYFVRCETMNDKQVVKRVALH